MRRLFYYRVTLCVSAVFAVARCLSICLCMSVTLVDCIQTAEDIVKLHSQPGSPIILVFWSRAPKPKSKETPSAWAQNAQGGKMLYFRLKSPFISEMVRDRPMVAIEVGNHGWRIVCRFRWPWVTRVSRSLYPIPSPLSKTVRFTDKVTVAH